jgi:hypothetical protein
MLPASDAVGVLSKMTVPRSWVDPDAKRARARNFDHHHAPTADPTTVASIPRVCLFTGASGLGDRNTGASAAVSET